MNPKLFIPNKTIAGFILPRLTIKNPFQDIIAHKLQTPNYSFHVSIRQKQYKLKYSEKNIIETYLQMINDKLFYIENTYIQEDTIGHSKAYHIDYNLVNLKKINTNPINISRTGIEFLNENYYQSIEKLLENER